MSRDALRAEILRRFRGGESIVSIAVSLSTEQPTSARAVESAVRAEMGRLYRIAGPVTQYRRDSGSVRGVGARGRA